MNFTRLTAPNLALLYREAAEYYDTLPAFATRIRSNNWKPVSFRELYQQGRALAEALIELGVAAREPVGLLADNRFEWILCDYAVQLCGAADVPRGRDVTDREISFILAHAGVKVLFVETAALQDRIIAMREQLPELREIILMDPKAEAAPGVHRLYDLLERGCILRIEGSKEVEKRVQGIRPQDLFTLIYTSGTTGEPKGVMLSHANMISQLEHIEMSFGCTDRILSILPVWHIFERVFEMLAISRGCCTYYSSVRHLSDDLLQVEPTFMGSAPRLWESLYEKILKKVKTQHPIRRALFHTAYFLSHYYRESVFYLTGRHIDTVGHSAFYRWSGMVFHALRWFILLPAYGFFNAAVLERLRQVMGGAFKASVSGGGALPRHVDQFFNYIGIPVLEGYGLTETCPVLAVRTPEKLVIGTVGPMIKQTELRIICLESGNVLYPDSSHKNGGRGLRGEIVVRGPQVMKGYFRNPEATAKSLKQGWFHTGDIGMVTFNDCLSILGRCKETIVLSSGENLEPVPIEMCLSQSPLIHQCIVLGQDRRHLVALIVPSLEGFADSGLSMDSLEELSKEPEARRRIQMELRQLVSTANGFKAYELIRGFSLLSQPFEVGRELTNLMKLKRHVIADQYEDLIDYLYKEGH
jgi:long-chain acyl-CoA synthetase